MKIPEKYEHINNDWYRCECGAKVYISESRTEDFRWHEHLCKIPTDIDIESPEDS